MQVCEALKILCGRPEALRRRLVTTDIWSGETGSVDASRPDPDCPTCGRGDFQYLNDLSRGSASLCGRDSVQIAPAAARSTSPDWPRRWPPWAKSKPTPMRCASLVRRTS